MDIFLDSDYPAQFTILYTPYYATRKQIQRRGNADSWKGRECNNNGILRTTP